MKTIAIALLGLAGLVALNTQAQTLKAVTVQPAAAKVGEPVTATAELDVSAGLNCGLRIHWGDGATEDVKINQQKDAALARTHSYAKPGNYTVKAEPKTMLPVAKCLGKNQLAQVSVAAAAPVAAAAAPAAAATAGAAATTAAAAAKPACPAGWAADPKASNKKTGAYGCKAKPGTPAPAERLACPGSLGYYENVKKGQLGCRP